MKYLLIAVFIFVVGCSNLTEEKVYVVDSTSLDSVFTIGTKHFDGTLRYKFKAEQKKNCNSFKDISHWSIFFNDKDGYKLDNEIVYRKDLRMRNEDDCTVSLQHFLFMNADRYRMIKEVKIGATKLKFN